MRNRTLNNRIINQVNDSQIKEQMEVASDNKKRIISLIEKNKDQILKAFPTQVNIDRVIRTIVTALSREPMLTKCTPVSILGCAIHTAQLGLEVDSLLGQCYFVPFYNSKRNVYEAQLIIGYRGYVDLAYRSGFVRSIYANVVYQGDTLEYEFGSEQKLRHIPLTTDKVKGWDDIILSYAYMYTTLGGFVFKILDKSELIVAKSNSKTKSELSAWNTSPAIMAMKSALRQVVKFAPLTPSLRLADMLASEYEGGGQNWDEIISIDNNNLENGNNESRQEKKDETKQTVQLQVSGTAIDVAKGKEDEARNNKQRLNENEGNVRTTTENKGSGQLFE